MKEILRIRNQERFYSVSILSKHFVLSNWDDDEIDEVDLFDTLEDHSHFTSHLINHIFFYYHLINHVIYISPHQSHLLLLSSHQSRHLQTHLISYVFKLISSIISFTTHFINSVILWKSTRWRNLMFSRNENLRMKKMIQIIRKHESSSTHFQQAWHLSYVTQVLLNSSTKHIHLDMFIYRIID